MIVDPAIIAEMKMLTPAGNNGRYLTMRCFVWLVRIVSGVLVFALFAGLIAGNLSGTIKPVEMPKSRVNQH